MTDRRLLAALFLSLLVHLTVIGSPGWRLPFLDEPEPSGMLEARLAPRPSPAPALKPSTTRPAAPKPRPPQPVPEERAVPEVAAPAASSEPAPAAALPSAPPAAPAPAPVELPWPHQGRIRFTVTRGEGEQTTLVGQSTHTWRHDDATYTLQTLTETVGLAALFRPAKVVQTSEGVLGEEGIVPREFRVERMGQTAERVRFDRDAMKVTLFSGERVRREAPLAAGSQDILSQIYQIGLTAAARVELMIATGKNYGRYAYEAVGEEKIATRFGELRTWHVKTPALPGEQGMDLWLASDYRNLPVRIRYLDRKGEVFEQNAVELEVDGARLATQDK
ncbi:MAG: DUF3108 domain-containing protein [Rhodocyclales bacterium]|nr:DUF3108 domain-containing protein [Rhodocyclales bacterium]